MLEYQRDMQCPFFCYFLFVSGEVPRHIQTHGRTQRQIETHTYSHTRKDIHRDRYRVFNAQGGLENRDFRLGMWLSQISKHPQGVRGTFCDSLFRGGLGLCVTVGRACGTA